MLYSNYLIILDTTYGGVLQPPGYTILSDVHLVVANKQFHLNWPPFK